MQRNLLNYFPRLYNTYSSTAKNLLHVSHCASLVRQNGGPQWLPIIHRWPLRLYLPTALLSPSLIAFQPHWSPSWFLEHSRMLLLQVLFPFLEMISPQNSRGSLPCFIYVAVQTTHPQVGAQDRPYLTTLLKEHPPSQSNLLF